MKKLLGLGLLAAASAVAQAPGFFPWWDTPIVRDLKLSEDQTGQIRETVRGYRDQLIEQRAELQKAEGHLEDLMNEDEVNEARTTEAIDRVVAARAALTRSFSLMSLKLRLVLTPAQWSELQRRRMERSPASRRFGERNRPRRGPQEPNRPPGPTSPPSPPGPGL